MGHSVIPSSRRIILISTDRYTIVRRSCICILVGILLLGFSSTSVQAQQVKAEVGPRVGLDRYGLRYFAGAEGQVSLPSLALGSQQLPVVVNPFFSYHFSVGGPDDAVLSVVDNLSPGFTLESEGSLSRFGVNALVNMSEWGTGESEGSPFDVYVGVGVALSRVSYEQRITVDEELGDSGALRYEGSDLVPGLNLITNATFSGNSLGTPFIRARITLAPRATVDLQKSVEEESVLLGEYPESQEYKSWDGTTFFALSVGFLFGV